MKSLIYFNEFVKEITSSNSKKFKQEVLQKYKDDEVIQKYLKICFDPFVVYGLSSKKLHKPVSCTAFPADNIFDLFYWLEKHNTGTDAAIKMCQETLDMVAAQDQEAAAILEKLICKDLSLGVDAKSINAAMPGLIPTFNVQLAQKYFEKPEKLEGKTFAITTKLDGFRLIAMKDEGGNVSFYSRVGQKVEGLVEIEAELAEAFPSGLVLDGELTISNYFDMESKEAYKAASKIIRLKGDTPKTGLTYRVFDGMHIDEWLAQNCTHTYDERRNLLEGLFGYAAAPIPHIELLPVLYRGDDTSKITELLDQVVAGGGEGVMCNVCSAPYVWTRSWNIVKVKKMNTLDLQVVGFEEGEGRLAGTLGAILVRYKGGNIVKVGSGFSDEMREQIWEHQLHYSGKIAEVQWFEETINADGGLSLRFPVFKGFREAWDKAEADF